MNITKPYIYLALIVCILAVIIGYFLFRTYTISYDDFQTMIPVPIPEEKLKAEFNLEITGIHGSVFVNDSISFKGYRTNNKLFYSSVIQPALDGYINQLKNQHPVEAINNLTLFTHKICQKYYGKSFYRWGGDLFDLDQPQERGPRSDKAYGMDCSGFVNMPYEIAVRNGILDSSSYNSAFSSIGFKYVCATSDMKDSGGRNNTSNDYRIDTKDIFKLGDLVIKVDSGKTPTDEQMSKLQAGDIVGRGGHVGILVEIEDELYYLESGGRILPNNGFLPFKARKALELWAERREVYVRRCLPHK